MSYDGPFVWAGLELLADDTLPPDHVKFLAGGEARVFRLDLETETGKEVARWPEGDADGTQGVGKVTGDAK